MLAVFTGKALLGTELDPCDRAVILVEDGRVTAAGRPEDVGVPDDAEKLDARDLFVLPGFIDAHVHIAFADPSDVLSGGVTTARDLAWPEEIWSLVEGSADPDHEGPTLLAVGPMVTVSGGYPTQAGWAPPGTGRPVADEAEARRAVDEIAQHDPAAIKVALNPDVGPTLSEEVLRAIVEQAHARGLIVTGHISGLEELRKALRAGIDELAHMLMSPERIPVDLISEMVAAGIVIVPTLSCRFGEDRTIAVENLSRFLSAGGKVIYGTDLGNQGPGPGIDRLEIQAMVDAGMDGRTVIASATTAAADHLGLDSGAIGPGRRADLIGVTSDPFDDPLRLVKPAFVMRGGRTIKGPSH